MNTELKGESVTTSLVTSDIAKAPWLRPVETTLPKSERRVVDRACRPGDVKEQKRRSEVENKRKKKDSNSADSLVN